MSSSTHPITGTGSPASMSTKGNSTMSESLYGGTSTRRITVRDLQAAKLNGDRWPMLTA